MLFMSIQYNLIDQVLGKHICYSTYSSTSLSKNILNELSGFYTVAIYYNRSRFGNCLKSISMLLRLSEHEKIGLRTMSMYVCSIYVVRCVHNNSRSRLCFFSSKFSEIMNNQKAQIKFGFEQNRSNRSGHMSI